MSRVESPFHAIAAQALDDNAETDANGPSAAATTVGSSSDARGQELDTVKAASDSHTENGGDEAADKSGGAEEEVEEETPVRPERKASLGVSSEGGAELLDTVVKKSKKRTNVWTKTTSRKSAKKGNLKNNGARQSDTKDDSVLLKPFHQEDDPSYPILLSKIYKAEKIELSVDRLTASGSKGYRMVRATRGVAEGAWYFEIFVERLGDTGHTRLGWSTRRGDLQAPVGYDAHSYSYRDVDGCKVHAALREDYGQAYHEKDVIGFYINLPREAGFTQKVEEEVYGYKGQPYVIVADEPLKPLPGSEILFFKNGVCQGVSFKDVNDGTYFPAASMYTLPSQDFCKVVFNFGPDFKYPVTDLGDRPFPAPMCQASGPGEARTEAAPTTQTEVVADPAKDSGGKQRMAPDSAKTLEVEEPRKATVEENVHKDVGKAPAVKKKDKMPKIPAGNAFPPPLSKKSKAGEPRLNPESKRDVNVQSFKKNTGGDGVASTGLPSHKGGKKDTVGTGLQNVKGVQKDVGLASLKGSKKDSTGTGLQSSKGIKKDRSGPGLPNFKGTGFPVFKGSKKETFKGNKKEITGIGLPSVKLSKKEVPVTGLQSHQRNKSDLTGPGLQSSKGTKRDASGLGPPIPKQRKKQSTGIGLALTPGKDLTGMRTAMKPSKKILPGTGSSVSKKDFARKGFMSRELGSSALSGQRSWGGRMPGTTMDVDVVVVESSTSFQGEGSFR